MSTAIVERGDGGCHVLDGWGGETTLQHLQIDHILLEVDRMKEEVEVKQK
jgi:hypothetical protein